MPNRETNLWKPLDPGFGYVLMWMGSLRPRMTPVVGCASPPPSLESRRYAMRHPSVRESNSTARLEQPQKTLVVCVHLVPPLSSYRFSRRWIQILL